MKREQLEKKVEDLDIFIKDSNNDIKALIEEQKIAIKKLEDIDKPTLTVEQFEKLQHVIESSCEEFDMDTHELEMELSIDYDNRIQVEHFDWARCQEDLTQHIISRLEEVFAVDIENKE